MLAVDACKFLQRYFGNGFEFDSLDVPLLGISGLVLSWQAPKRDEAAEMGCPNDEGKTLVV